MPTPQKHILIVGGGLAGIAAAVTLAAQPNLHVTLLESRHALGGRASSFEDPENPNEELDNCQHVLLGCCTNLLDLYDRLGVRNRITFHKSVHFLNPAGKRCDLYGLPILPAPLHLGLSFLLFSLLTIAERAAVMRAQLAMLRLGKSGREKLETLPFGDWLDQHHQPPGLIKKFYDPVLISALNEETRAASAKYAIQVFQDAMLANRRGYLMGLPNCPLGELYRNVPGVNVRLNTRADEILFEKANDWRATGVKLRTGEVITADAVVLATNHHAVQRWIPDHLKTLDPRFAGLDKIQSVPILGAHLFFDRPVMKIAAAALIEGPLQWLFRKDTEGKILHGVISAAREWPSIPKATALAQFEAQVHKLFPHAADAKLLRGIIIIEKRATFSPLPGADSLRPSQSPPVGGIQSLHLAADYTKTNWPATMEGAVRSGYLAAESVLKQLGNPRKIMLSDLPIQWPARLMGLGK